MKVSSRYTPLDGAESRARADEMLGWLRDWSERRLSSRLMDERRSVQPQALLDLGNHGFMGVQVEEKYGGLALRNRDIARAARPGRGDRPLARHVPARLPVPRRAPDRRVRLVAAEGRGAARPGERTHARRLRADRARRRHALQRHGRAGDRASRTARWLLSGDKVWIGNAQWSNVLTVVAHDVGRERPAPRTDGVRGAHRSARRRARPRAAVDGHARRRAGRGLRSATCVVDRDHVVGEPKRGLEVGVDSMSWSRFAIASTCVGTLRRTVQLLERFGARREIATGTARRSSGDARSRSGSRRSRIAAVRGAARVRSPTRSTRAAKSTQSSSRSQRSPAASSPGTRAIG